MRVTDEWFAWWEALGWRAWLLAGIVVLAIYVLLSILRLRRLSRRQSGPTASERNEPQSSADAAPAAPIAASDPPPAWNEPPPRFAERQIVLSLERQVIQLREELDALRGAFATLRDETQAALEKAKVAQNISPLYGDAMQMALAGESAETIAGRCGVARAEAELVVAMVNRAQGELGDDAEDDSQMALDGFDAAPESERFGAAAAEQLAETLRREGYAEDERWLKR